MKIRVLLEMEVPPVLMNLYTDDKKLAIAVINENCSLYTIQCIKTIYKEDKLEDNWIEIK